MRVRFFLFLSIGIALRIFTGCGQDTGPERVPIPPEVTITEPDDDEEFPLGELVEFIGELSDGYDPESELECLWTATHTNAEGDRVEEELGRSNVDNDGLAYLGVSTLVVGLHEVQLTVTDSDGLTGHDFISVEIFEVDDPPTLEITSPMDGDSSLEGDTVLFAAVTDDDHDAADLIVRWTSNLDSVLYESIVSDTGVSQFQTETLSVGEHQITADVFDGASQAGSDAISYVVLLPNQPPSMPTVIIEPLGAQTEDDLTCVPSGSVDPEGGAVTFEYAWDLDGVGSGWSSQTVPSVETVEGEQWACWATPRDDAMLAGEPGYAVVTIGNTLPSYSNVTLTPTTAFETSILSCTPAGWFDPDGHAEGALFEWWVGGAALATPAGDTLDGTWFDAEDEVVCQVTPWDGVSEGLTLTSNAVVVSNSEPGSPTVEVTPQPLHTDEDVVCVIIAPATDVDADALSYEYEWSLDGVIVAAYTSDLVPAADTELGDEWTCRVRAFDGLGYSGWVEDHATVVPREGDLVITELMVAPGEVDDALGEYIELFNASAEAIVLDGFEISDAGAELHVVNSGGTAVVESGAYFVLGTNANFATNGGVFVDYQYADIELDEVPDAVTIAFQGVDVDSVAYDWGVTFPAPVGSSLSLDPQLIHALDNDDGASWCGSTTPLFEWGDFGTPGQGNDPCDCWYSDADLDGFGVDPTCPADYLDCDDTEATVHPGATDICWDAVDQDCDGADRECTCEESDADGDGFGTSIFCVQLDCDDTDPLVFPGASEPCNGLDDDCDGDVDEGFDVDGDGFTSCGDDCNDGDAQTHPDADELCDGVDNDCDGEVDEDEALDASTWFADGDGDGVGDSGVTTEACDQPTGYVAVDGDCDDANAGAFPGNVETCDGVDNDCDGDLDEADAADALTWYGDLDADGFGDAASPMAACDQPVGYVSDDTDCDDSDPEQHPGASELCNGEDDDCDGTVDEADAVDAATWYRDLDGDGFGDSGSTENACSQPEGYVANSTDCDDLDAGQHPGAAEHCSGEDDDCDGEVDEDAAVEAQDWYRDQDGDSYGDAASLDTDCYQPTGYVADATDCDDLDALQYPGADELCNGEDDDCDGSVDEADAIDALPWYADADGDGFGDPAAIDIACDPLAGYVADDTDCDDLDDQQYPGADELCNGEDDDCDGSVDEADAVDAQTWFRDLDDDGYGDAGATEIACSQPAGYVANATDCDDLDAAQYPGAAEHCSGEDDDCDGQVDEDEAVEVQDWYRDQDGDSYGDAANMDTDCYQPAGYVADATDCDDLDGLQYPGADELCNGEDDDCDGFADEADAIDAAVWYEDLDDDGHGNPAIHEYACDQPAGFAAAGDDCDDGDAGQYPGANEWCNAEDDDCDGTVDEDDALDVLTWYEDLDDDGHGNPLVVDQDCDQPVGFVLDATDCDDGDPYNHPGNAEACDGMDNDCDGAADEGLSFLDWYLDADDDGYGDPAQVQNTCDGAPTADWVLLTDDCDDADADQHPGADEVCNGEDDDCDGATDDAAIDAQTWYRDQDHDGHGDVHDALTQCDPPYGYVSDNTDCDDGDDDQHPGADEVCNDEDDDCDGTVDEDDALDVITWYEDADDDGYGNVAVTDVDCDQPTGFVLDATDCDDGDGDRHPGADELCNDTDDDCDGFIDEYPVDAPVWYIDYDQDGYGTTILETVACDQPASFADNADDCNDMDPLVHPSADESCNGVDDDCDGTVDEEDALLCSMHYYDGDQDGYGWENDPGRCLCAPDGSYSSSQNTDCYDVNDQVFPGQTAYFSSQRGDGSFDYDCDGGESPHWTTIYDCNGNFPWGCWNWVDGWDDNHASYPDCGESRSWWTGCDGAGGGCWKNGQASRTQECR